MEKLCYYTENYGTMIYKVEKQGRLSKTMEIGFIMEKSMVKYQNKFLNKKNRLRTLIYCGKTMVLQKKLWYYGTMEKLWYYGKKYGTMEKLRYYRKNYGTMEKLWYYRKN